MIRKGSFAIPLFVVGFTCAALLAPWWPIVGGAPGVGPRDWIDLTAGLTGTAAVGLVLLAAVRRRDLTRIGNARMVLASLGGRPMPVDRLVKMAVWSGATLHEDLIWGHTLNAAAALVKTLIRLAAIIGALGATGLAISSTGLDLPGVRDLGLSPDWRDWIGLAGPMVLLIVSELSLGRRDDVALPSHHEIRAAMAHIGERLEDPRVQIGIAAMTGVDQGLDVVIPMMEERLKALGRRPLPPRGEPARPSEPDDETDGDDFLEELRP